MSKAITLEPRVPADLIRQAAESVRIVKSIDEIIEWLARDSEASFEKWGGGVRNVFGANRMSQMSELRLGQVSYRAIVDHLLLERAEVAAEWEHLVEFPEPPVVPEVKP